MAIGQNDLMGMAHRFHVVINPANRSLGTWAKASGLEVKWDVPEYRSGEDWNYVWTFPGITKYQTIKLERAVVAKDTKEVKKWLDETALTYKSHEITITVYDAHGEASADWTCVSAFPSKWSVVQFDAGSSKIATETLELNHSGFLADQRKLK